METYVIVHRATTIGFDGIVPARTLAQATLGRDCETTLP